MRHAIAVGLTCWLAAATAWAQADLVLRGGPIHTAEDAAPTAEAVAVDGGRIVYVGAASGAEALIGPATEVIELKGAALYPGFTDAHAHLLGIGLREMTLNLEGVASLAELVDAVRARVAETAPGAVIAGRGWIETHWPEARFPTAADLDAAAADNPVILTRADGHALVANSAALARAGIDAATPAPAGGDILRDAAGRPTGMLIDKAMDLLAGVAPQPTPARRQAAFETGAGVYARYGWTGVHNMSVDPADLGVIALRADPGRLPLRVYTSVDRAGVDALLATGARTTGSGRVVTRAIKLYADRRRQAGAPVGEGLLRRRAGLARGGAVRALRRRRHHRPAADRPGRNPAHPDHRPAPGHPGQHPRHRRPGQPPGAGLVW